MGRCRTLGHSAAVAGLLGAVACSGPAADRPESPVFARQIAQAGNVDSATLLAIPSAIARDVAGDLLVSVSTDRLARTFGVETYSGRPGVFSGFAPGFDGAVFNRSRYLRRGNLLVPYAPIDSHFIPVATTSETAPDMFFYPVLVEEGGAVRPLYLAATPPLLATYGVVFPVRVGATYVSPVDLGRVPPAAIDRPFINLRTPNTTSVATLGGGTTTSVTSATGGTGVTGVTGTTTATGTTTGGRVVTTTGPAMTTTTGPATTTLTGPAMTTTTGPATTTTSSTGPATTTTSTTGRSVSSTVSTGPASVTTTSSTGHKGRYGVRLRENSGSGRQEER